jgi:hypothetical protein
MTMKERQLRDELEWVRGKYDGGGMPPALYSALREIEIEIAWMQHRERLGERPGLLTARRYKPGQHSEGADMKNNFDLIDWDEVWSNLPTERCDDDRTPLDDERDVFLARVREEEGWKAYCRLVDAEMEFTIHLCRGGYLL